MSSSVRYVSRESLEADNAVILARYPQFATYPVECHESCARWDIDREYGPEAGSAWDRWRTNLFLMGES